MNKYILLAILILVWTVALIFGGKFLDFPLAWRLCATIGAIAIPAAMMYAIAHDKDE